MKKVVISVLCLLVIATGVIVIVNSTKNVNNTEDETVEHTASINDEKDIFASIPIEDADEKIKVGDTGEVYDFSDIVVIGTVLSKGNATMSQNSSMPYTPGTFKVEKVIKGNVDSDVIDIQMAGGTCTVQEFIDASKTNFPERIEKMGLNNLTDEEKKTKYIEYKFPHQKDFEVGKQYVLMLSVSEGDSVYHALSDAGFLDLVDSNSIDDINTKEDILNMPNAKFE